jgi:hypothetical protein
MPLLYRRPGVYLEESLLNSAGDVSNATSVAMFVGAAPKGPVNPNNVPNPVRIETWGDFVSQFGGFDPVPTGTTGVWAKSYLPYAVYSYLQNGGRTAYIVRSVDSAVDGDASTKVVTGFQFNNGSTAGNAFTITAKSAGVWGDRLSYTLRIQEVVYVTGSVAPIEDVVYSLQVLLTTNGVAEVVDTFNVCAAGTVSGVSLLADAVNDPVRGSTYIQVSNVRTDIIPAEALSPVSLTAGADPHLPISSDLRDSAIAAIPMVEGPVVLNIAGYVSDQNSVNTTDWATDFVGATCSSTDFSDRQDVFIVNDNCAPRLAGVSSSSYLTAMQSTNALGANAGDSYCASYGPWVLVNDPVKTSTVVAIPPGGAVMGMMARIDATIGVFRAPAGVIAGLNNVIGVQTKFTDTELGTLNNSNINAIRSVVGAGIAVMGARTRKSYNADRYVSARRTLIYIREVLRRSTQFAVFENNDARLWSSLRMSAERILRPLWEAGGLRGSSAAEAYFIRCDDSVNTPSVIAAGEVRMEIGVALEYPAEFVVIRVSQFDRTQTTTEVTTTN